MSSPVSLARLLRLNVIVLIAGLALAFGVGASTLLRDAATREASAFTERTHDTAVLLQRLLPATAKPPAAGQTPSGAPPEPGVEPFDARALQRLLEVRLRPDEGLLLVDNRGQAVARAGAELPPGGRGLSATAPVGTGGWRLEAQTPRRGALGAHLLPVAVGLAFTVVAVAVWFYTIRLLRLVTREVGTIGTVLRQLGANRPVLDIAPSHLQELEDLATEVRRIAAEQERKAEAIAELALTDPVTRLPYRTAFFDHLRHAFELARRGSSICLCLIDVEGFQRALNVLGQEAADHVLRQLAETLRAHTRKSDYPARLGVLSFAVILYNAKGELMRPRLEQLQRDFAERQEKSSETAHQAYCRLTLALVSLAPHVDATPEGCYQNAAGALHTAKQVGGDYIEIKLAPAAAPTP